jgi:hypothetical protein
VAKRPHFDRFALPRCSIRLASPCGRWPRQLSLRWGYGELGVDKDCCAQVRAESSIDNGGMQRKLVSR